ncbi:MAG: hypothetical protein IBJ11_09780 [Phycisphaerales bacterium]|nr:hypothetical protein [Phycisphaerales bacterium]
MESPPREREEFEDFGDPGSLPGDGGDDAGGPGERLVAVEGSATPFPVIVLAAPGALLLLAVVMVDRLVYSLGSVGLALGAVVLAAVGSAGCFGVIAAKSRERRTKLAAGGAIGLVVVMLGLAVLRLV